MSHLSAEKSRADRNNAAKNIKTMSAIIMEYLQGEDMHQLRERHCTLLQQKGGTAPVPQLVVSTTKCRVNLCDAVYLTADCMLPLLKQMHNAGVIHRDVKPSNCVRTGTTDGDRRFKIVDASSCRPRPPWRTARSPGTAGPGTRPTPRWR